MLRTNNWSIVCPLCPRLRLVSYITNIFDCSSAFRVYNDPHSKGNIFKYSWRSINGYRFVTLPQTRLGITFGKSHRCMHCPWSSSLQMIYDISIIFMILHDYPCFKPDVSLCPDDDRYNWLAILWVRKVKSTNPVWWKNAYPFDG